MMAPHTSFVAHRTKWLRRKGLAGEVTVTWAGGALHLQGARGGLLSITPEEIQRLQAAYTQRNGVKSYYVQLWLADEGPLFLSYRGMGGDQRRRFGATLRELLAEMERRGLIGRAVGGLLWHKPWRLPVIMGLFSLGACGLVFWLLRGEPLWQRLLPAYIMVPVVGVCVWAARAYRPPGPARSLADVEPRLPPVET
jgi:hypothetical protein